MGATSQDQGDLHHQEISAARTAVLNRELVRLRSDGWAAARVGDHLEASRGEPGRSQLERVLISVAALLAIAFLAESIAPDLVAKIGISTIVFYAGAVVLGAVAALLTGSQAAATRRISVGVDGLGRAFTTDV